MPPWLLLDTSYLCWRAAYSMGQLTHEDVPTGVMFGFFRDLVTLQDKFQTNRLVFCFDSPTSRRRDIYPGYKASRETRVSEMPQDEQLLIQNMRQQIGWLRNRYLPYLGYTNLLYAEGYESDDHIAYQAKWLSVFGSRCIIISSDEDLYQCINTHVRHYCPGKDKLVTIQTFKEEWGIDPPTWAHVKAIAGCTSDEVVGVPGVGNKTAAKYLRGELKPTTKAYQAIEANRTLWRENLKLVRLPFRGLPKHPSMVEGTVTADKWRALMDKLGMKSLRDAPPIPTYTARMQHGTRQRQGTGFREGLLQGTQPVVDESKER